MRGAQQAALTATAGVSRTSPAGRLRAGRAAIVALTIFYVAGFIFVTWPMPGYSRDISSFLASGRAAADGQDPYGVYELMHRSEVNGITVAYPNLNPPVTVLAFEALAGLPPLLVYRLWYLAGLAAYALIVWRLARAYPERTNYQRVAWALCMTGLWSTLGSGQVYLLLAVAATGAWLALKRDYRFLAGVLIGLVVAVKPNLLVWPALLILSGAATAGWVAVGTTVVLSALPILRYGPPVYAQWLAAVQDIQWVQFPHNMSLMGVAARFGLSSLGPVLAVALLGALALWAYRRRPAPLAASETSIVASFLAAPLAWPSFLLFLVPALWSRRWSRLLAAGAILLLFPSLLVVYFGGLSPAGAIAAGLIYPVALGVLLAGFVRTRAD